MSPRSKINSSGRVMGERQEVEFSRRTNGGMEVGLVEEQKQVERDEKRARKVKTEVGNVFPAHPLSACVCLQRRFPKMEGWRERKRGGRREVYEQMTPRVNRRGLAFKPPSLMNRAFVRQPDLHFKCKSKSHL